MSTVIASNMVLKGSQIYLWKRENYYWQNVLLCIYISGPKKLKQAQTKVNRMWWFLGSLTDYIFKSLLMLRVCTLRMCGYLKYLTLLNLADTVMFNHQGFTSLPYYRKQKINSDSRGVLLNLTSLWNHLEWFWKTQVLRPYLQRFGYNYSGHQYLWKVCKVIL